MLVPLLLLSAAFVSDPSDVSNPIISRTNCRASPPPEPAQEEEWSESITAYMSVMCLIMHCGAGRSAPSIVDSVQLWISTYDARGLKSDLTATERLWAKSQVLQLQQLAATDPGFLSPELRSSFINSLTSILSELDP